MMYGSVRRHIAFIRYMGETVSPFVRRPKQAPHAGCYPAHRTQAGMAHPEFCPNGFTFS